MSQIRRVERVRELLRSGERFTAPALAEAVGASVRTVMRDLAYLREAGMPLEGEAGRGGGLRMLGDRGVTAVHLSFDEIASLWMASSLARVASGLPWGGAARGALDKLLASVPKSRAKELRSLLRRVVIGAPAPPELVAGAGSPTSELLRCVEEAFRRGMAIAFDYRDRLGKATRRTVEPHGLLVQPPIWYVLAIDVEKQKPRMFRMDRIARPSVIKGHGFVPKQSVVEQILRELPIGNDQRGVR
jgi:predicted DNA-binding transcriptional regulator YafY